MVKWGFQKGSTTCECEESQSDELLKKIILTPPGCATEDLTLANANSI